MEECYFTSLPATLLRVTLLHHCFSRCFNFTNGIKSCKASHIFVQSSLIIHALTFVADTRNYFCYFCCCFSKSKTLCPLLMDKVHLKAVGPMREDNLL